MAGQYSHKSFFRKVPNSQLIDYFTRRKVELPENAGEWKKLNVDGFFDVFNSLPEEEQGVIEAQFQDINAMACEGGIQALIDESGFHKEVDFVENIAGIDGFHAKAMWAFLEKPVCWRGATMFLHADNAPNSYWKKRNDLPHVPPRVDDEDIEKLEDAISAYFRKTEGRGKNCKVEPYRRDKKEYFFAYPEDYAQSGIEWDKNTLKTRARHPAFEIIFVYCEAEGSLDIYAKGNSKAVKTLQAIFARTILGLNTLDDAKIDKRVYDLKPVTEQGFEFKITPEMGIESVAVTRLRLKLHHGTMRRITLEANTAHEPRAVYDLLDELNPPPHSIDQIGVRVRFVAVDNKRGGFKDFNISYPNSCNLNHSGKDLIIRQMLGQSGLEPQVSADAK